MELWLAPGNSELRVAQNEIPLHRWRRVDAAAGVPAAGACGFEPETGPREGCGVPQDMQGKPFAVRRDGAGRPLAAPFEAPRPSESSPPSRHSHRPLLAHVSRAGEADGAGRGARRI